MRIPFNLEMQLQGIYSTCKPTHMCRDKQRSQLCGMANLNVYQQVHQGGSQEGKKWHVQILTIWGGLDKGTISKAVRKAKQESLV